MFYNAFVTGSILVWCFVVKDEATTKDRAEI
jgi:hypothetical protein